MKLIKLKTKLIKYIANLALVLSVTACAASQDVASKNAFQSDANSVQQQPSYLVTEISVTIPHELTVSEANVYIPLSDIVWREDPLGNRKVQILDILMNAIDKGVTKVDAGQPVTMEVRLNKFHAVSEKTRYTVGGRHNIVFDYILRDATSGIPIGEAKTMDASLKAYGGARAIAAVAHGETQKARITQHIENLMYLEMSGQGKSS